ncbi:MAG: type I-E CRISPR-associated protein Cse1/CasA [Thermoguttaceae bacterium]
MSYNLLEENWIPVLYRDGRWCRVSIRTALKQAGQIRQIAASNPLDNVATVRFLTAVLLWCKPTLSEQDFQQLAQASGIPHQWLAKLGVPGQPAAAFELLGEGPRFYQENAEFGGKWRPIGDLLIEFPTDTKLAHFRHVQDYKYGLCLACCALGIVRFCAFANYAGKGYTSGINGPTPAYRLLEGASLLDSLALNWPKNISVRRKPPWLEHSQPKEEELDAMTVFAWRPRRIWLESPEATRSNSYSTCSYCGAQAPLVVRLRFAGGWKPPFGTRGADKKFWAGDPHLIFVDTANETANEAGEDAGDAQQSETLRRASRGATGGKKTTLGFPRPSWSARVHAGFWRKVLAALGLPLGRAQGVFIAGPAASQTGMLYQDAAYLRLPCFSSGDPATVATLLEAIARVVQGLTRVLKRAAPNPKQKHLNRAALLHAMAPDLEAALRHELFQWLQTHQGTDRESWLEHWKDTLWQQLLPVVERVVLATAPGSPLRQLEAIATAQKGLRDSLSQAFAKPGSTRTGAADSPAAPATGEKPGRASQKRSRTTRRPKKSS